MNKFILIVCFCVIISGCGNTTNKVISITRKEVVEYMDDGAVLIDVRTEEEYDDNHIEGAINIDVDTILKTENLLIYNNAEIDKNAKIIVYCRSGARSANAANRLIELGYTSVYDFGSIDNWNK